jgi:hypothetical protein
MQIAHRQRLDASAILGCETSLSNPPSKHGCNCAPPDTSPSSCDRVAAGFVAVTGRPAAANARSCADSVSASPASAGADHAVTSLRPKSANTAATPTLAGATAATNRSRDSRANGPPAPLGPTLRNAPGTCSRSADLPPPPGTTPRSISPFEPSPAPVAAADSPSIRFSMSCADTAKVSAIIWR